MTAPGALMGRTVALLPDASTFAPGVDSIFAGLMAASLAVVGILGILTVGILIRYRRGASVNRAPLKVAIWKIETAWIAGTTVIFLVFFWRGASVFLEMRRPPKGAQEITVVGRQWMWDIRYADGRREFNALHVRVNQPVLLEMSSEDVIHSLFVPAFRLKQDLVPGRIVDAWFTPTKPGTYSLFCTQYCGAAHAEMIGKVIVLEGDAYAAWMTAKPEAVAKTLSHKASSEHGRALFANYGCAACHDAATGARGPKLAGIYQSVVRQGDGRTIRAEDQFLHDAILHARSNALAGYALRMPDYGGLLTEPEVADLVSYVKSLGTPRLTSASP
jgi:cytochrome c oxidase subunit II